MRSPYGKAVAYAKQYNTDAHTVRHIGVEALDRMTDDARAVIFSTLKWEASHYRKPRSKNFKSRPEKKVAVERMLELTTRAA